MSKYRLQMQWWQKQLRGFPIKCITKIMFAFKKWNVPLPIEGPFCPGAYRWLWALFCHDCVDESSRCFSYIITKLKLIYLAILNYYNRQPVSLKKSFWNFWVSSKYVWVKFLDPQVWKYLQSLEYQQANIYASSFIIRRETPHISESRNKI